MTRPAPILGYPSKSHAALALRRQGKKQREIAEILGVSLSSVGNLIRHATAGKGAGETFPLLGELPGRTRARLNRAAKARGITVRELTKRLLQTAASSGLVDAILDDRSETQ